MEEGIRRCTVGEGRVILSIASGEGRDRDVELPEGGCTVDGSNGGAGTCCDSVVVLALYKLKSLARAIAGARRCSGSVIEDGSAEEEPDDEAGRDTNLVVDGEPRVVAF